MSGYDRKLWEAADSLLGGELFLEEEEMETEELPAEGEEEMVDLDEPLPDMPVEEEAGLTNTKIMQVIDDLAAETEDEEKDEFLKNLSAELEDDQKMECMISICERLFEDMDQDDQSDEELEDAEPSDDMEDIDLPDEDEI